MRSLVIVIALAGCADVSTIVSVAPSADSHAEQVARAADRLNAIVGADVYVVHVTDSESRIDGEVIVRRVESLPVRGRIADCTSTLFGVVIRVRDGTMDVHVAHELGHAAGLPHVNDPDNLMYRAPTGWGLDSGQVSEILEAR